MKDERKKILLATAFVILALLAVWFLSIHHEIDVEVDGKGTVSPDGARTGHLGTATFDFFPDDGWELKEVLLDGEPVGLDDGKLILKRIVSNHTVKALFEEIGDTEKHTLTVTSNGYGSTSPSGTSTYDTDTDVRVVITPDQGYVIDDVKVDGESLGSKNVVELVMYADRTVDVTFRQASDIPSGDTPADPWVDISVDVQIVTTGADYGTIEPSGKVRVAYGGSLTVTIGLNEGYSLESVTVDGIPEGISSTVVIKNIVSDVSIDIVVSHAVRTYTVTASTSSGGTISPSGDIKVAEGGDVEFAISAMSGYRLSSLTVDGASVGSGLFSYTLKNVTKDATVYARFVADSSPTPQPPVETLSSISVLSHPMYCYIGESIDESMQITASYIDGSTQTQTGTCSPTSWTDAGKKTVTVSYGGKSCTFELTVPTLSGIAVTQEPSRTTFAVGETVSLDGMEVVASYIDGPSRTVTVSYERQMYAEVGTRDITISYSEGDICERTTFRVTIVAIGGLRAVVTSYSGTRMEDGTVVSFSNPTMSTDLEDFAFDTANIVPGISQTVQLTVINGSQTTLDACIYVSSISEANELSEQIQLSSGERTSTVKDAANASFIGLGRMDPGSTQTFSLTMTFVEGPDNNLAMGQTLAFSVGVFAGQATEGGD